MNKFLFLIGILFTSGLLHAQTQETGTIAGKLLDQEMAEEPLPFANVVIQGTSKGATTNIDGEFSLTGLEPSTYTIVFSYVGYETVEVPNVKVVAGKVTEISTKLGSNAAALDEVVISVVSREDSEIALLLEQKKAVQIQESIGAQELAKLGVSDAAMATTKISGVSSSEASGDIYVRGLGDRYLYTTLNNLPIPSDDVERKNIDLALFPTRVIQSIAISKTYTAENSADQASGTINIETRELTGNEEYDLGAKVGVNTNVIDKFSNFKVSANQDDVYLGFYDQDVPLQFALNNQGWDPGTATLPMNRSYAFTAGKEFGDNLDMLFTGSQSTNFEYSSGLFREYSRNNLYDYFSDTENFSKTDNTTGLLDVGYEINNDHLVKFTSLFINKLTDEVYEAGRNAEGVVYDETAVGDNLNQFIRDQNIKQTRLWVNQLHGNHLLTEWNELEWAIGYNLVSADEPNRIRNELNINDKGFVQLASTGGYQQRKSFQVINDNEINAFVEDEFTFINDGDLNKNLFLKIGGSYRNKERDFASKFFGVTESTYNSVHPSSIDNLSEVFTTESFQNRLLEVRDDLPTDTYDSSLESYGGFSSVNYGSGKWNVNLGARYQKDEILVDFNVNNYPSTLPQNTIKSYSNVYPSLNVKFSPGENSNIRLAASKTITLPEFKEIAPFPYVSQTGQVTVGNPDLEASRNYNLDLKYELFPSTGQLISLTGFYKKIKDPINKVQDRGAAGWFSYFNAGEEANIYGLELEAKLEVIDNETPEGVDFEVAFNATRMWHEQDLKEVYRDGTFIRTFRYNNKADLGLQGASDWIFNGSLNFSTESDNPFTASIVANYASDKIYAIGAAINQYQPDVDYNDEIIEKGFVTLDAIFRKDLDKHWNLQLRGQNLLNPNIDRVQEIRPSSTGIETTHPVRSYTKGAVISFGIGYSF